MTNCKGNDKVQMLYIPPRLEVQGRGKLQCLRETQRQREREEEEKKGWRKTGGIKNNRDSLTVRLRK